MSDKNNSGNLSKGDVISFVALLLMGVLVFFGMNFMTLGDKIPSIVVAILTVVLMTVFVFLAAYAKAQDRNQSTWKKVEYSMLVLYVLALIPCYIFSAKFFDVQFDKDNVMKQVQTDTNDLNKLFNDYNRKCESRVSAYQIDLESMLTTTEGRSKLASLLEINDPSSVTKESVTQAAQSFSKSLKGAEYKALEAEKNNLVKNCETNFNNWNIMFIPQYAYELGTAKDKYATELERIYGKTQNNIEKNIPEFETASYTNESGIINTFKSTDKFSVIGLLVVLFLGFLGLVKYLLGDKSTVIPIKQGDTSVIGEDGGFTF
jgi:hypothetical protein